MLIITVSAKIKPEFQQQFLRHMKTLAITIREEEGAVNFEQNLSIDDPNRLFVYEEWASLHLFNKHLETEHMQSHFATVTPWVESLTMKSFEANEIAV